MSMRVILQLGFAGVLLLAATVPSRAADESVWELHMDAAELAESEGRLEQAEAELLLALEEASRAGVARMLLARSTESLADFMSRNGRPEKAEDLYLEVIGLWEEVLGPDQPRVGIPVHNLAVLYLDTCRVEEALPLVERVVGLWGRTLGERHPDRVAAVRTEATLLRRCGRTAEAARLEARLP